MDLQPIFEKINVKNPCGEISTQIKTETKTDILSDSIRKVLGVTAFATVQEENVSDGMIKFGGRVIYYIAYIDSDGALKKAECGSEYVGALSDEIVKSCCDVSLNVSTEKTDVDVSGTKLVVATYLNVNAKLSECIDVNALSGGENLILNNEEKEIIKGFGIRKGVYPVEEEFEISFPIAEVLSQRARAVITAVQCGVGCIIVDGEVYLSALLLQSSEKKDIIREDKNIPFRMEIECEEAMPTMFATASVKEKSFKTDIAVDGESGKSIVTASVSLQFEGEAFAVENHTLATDVFSTAEELETTFDECGFYKPCEPRNVIERVLGRVDVEEFSSDARIVATYGEKVEIVSTSCAGGEIKVTGVLSANAFIKSQDEDFSIRIETPFEVGIQCGTTDCCKLEVKAIPLKATVRVVTLSSVDIEAEIAFSVFQAEKNTFKYIKEVKSLGEKPVCNSAISVYIPTEGEELWSLAKRLNVCPEALISTNKDLQFPLSGKERIVIYRQK